MTSHLAYDWIRDEYQCYPSCIRDLEFGVFQGVLPESDFSRSIRDFLPHVTCRKPANDEEKEQIYRLRYSAYLKEGALPPGAPEIFKDAYDDAPNCSTLGLYVAGRLSSSVRVHVATKQSPVMPAMTTFADLLQPLLDRGQTILDPTRFVVDAAAARLYPRLPYATVRVCTMAGAYFGADVVLATVRAEHQSFYKRLFSHRVLCPPRPYPTLSKPISLMAIDYFDVRAAVAGRYPCFGSNIEERRAIFEGSGTVCGRLESDDLRTVKAHEIR